MTNEPELIYFPAEHCLRLRMKNEIITFGCLMSLGGNRAVFTTSLAEIVGWLEQRWSPRTVKKHLRLLETSNTVVLTWLPQGRLRVQFPHLG